MFVINGSIFNSFSANPHIITSVYFGHVINDILNIEDFSLLIKNIPITKEYYPLIIEYYKEKSRNLSNVEFLHLPNLPLIAVVSKKYIHKNEELFVSNGLIYWLHKLKPELSCEYICNQN